MFYSVVSKLPSTDSCCDWIWSLWYILLFANISKTYLFISHIIFCSAVSMTNKIVFISLRFGKRNLNLEQIKHKLSTWLDTTIRQIHSPLSGATVQSAYFSLFSVLDREADAWTAVLTSRRQNSGRCAVWYSSKYPDHRWVRFLSVSLWTKVFYYKAKMVFLFFFLHRLPSSAFRGVMLW